MAEQLKLPFGGKEKRDQKGAKKEVLDYTIYLKEVAQLNHNTIYLRFLVIKPDGVEIEVNFTFKKDKKKVEVQKKVKRAPAGMRVFLNKETYSDAMYLPRAVYNEIHKWARSIYNSKLKRKEKSLKTKKGSIQQGKLNFEN